MSIDMLITIILFIILIKQFVMSDTTARAFSRWLVVVVVVDLLTWSKSVLKNSRDSRVNGIQYFTVSCKVTMVTNSIIVPIPVTSHKHDILYVSPAVLPCPVPCLPIYELCIFSVASLKPERWHNDQELKNPGYRSGQNLRPYTTTSWLFNGECGDLLELPGS